VEISPFALRIKKRTRRSSLRIAQKHALCILKKIYVPGVIDYESVKLLMFS